MTFFVETLGCPKNVNDSQIVVALLEQSGHKLMDNPYDSDIILVNTCGFINDAKIESINVIFDMINIKGDKSLIVTGCLSERYVTDLIVEMPEVDFFLGVNEYETLPDLFSQIADMSHKKSDSMQEKNRVTHSVKQPLKYLPRTLDQNPYSATLKIAEGCNNSCGFCIIPSIRGSYRSKLREDVLKEANELAEKGCKEIIIIAQDTTLYGYDIYGKLALPELLRDICKIDKLQWVRLMYCYENRITDELIEVMRDEPKICPYIDIPIQHCNDRILSSMNRHSTKSSLENIIRKLRENISDIHIRTTLIVGLPTETDEEFDQLCDFVEDMKFDRLGVFAYSQEEGTAAGEMDGQIDEEIKQERLDTIMRTQLEISLESNRKKIGTPIEVIVEEIQLGDEQLETNESSIVDLRHDLEKITYIGRTIYDAPEIDNAVAFTYNRLLKIGEIVTVKINDAHDYDLVGSANNNEE